MKSLKDIFSVEKPIIGMIHVPALPGTPRGNLPVSEIITAAVNEAKIYQNCGVNSVILENMHDVPYLNRDTGPEITAVMAVVASSVKATVDIPVGVQVLAGANKEAMAVAMSAELQFIRVEGYVYGHLADEVIWIAAPVNC